MERRLQYLNHKELTSIMDKGIRGILLPTGTIEAHGCGPLGTDNIIPEDISIHLAEKFDFLIAPPVNYGITHSLLPYRGSITLKDDTFYNHLLEILIQLSRNKFDKIIIINGHGGNNEIIKKALNEFYRREQKYIAVIHWWDLIGEVTENFYKEKGAHAGIDENAMVLAINPELVKPELFDEEDMFNYRKGLKSVPVPGPIISYKEGEGKPEFDIERARKFRLKVLSYIEDRIQELITKWERITEHTK